MLNWKSALSVMKVYVRALVSKSESLNMFINFFSDTLRLLNTKKEHRGNFILFLLCVSLSVYMLGAPGVQKGALDS